MPILATPQIQFTIGDLENEVILRSENKTTDVDRADVWLRDALLEISGNPDYRESFDELEVYGPLHNLTPFQQEYDFDNFVLAGDYNLETLDVLLWTDYPTNSIRKQLKPNNFQDTDKFQQASSIPSQWYRFGDTIGFNPLPNQPFQAQARIMRRHPINDDILRDTVILLPREWNEVLIYAAVIRAFIEYLEYEKAGSVKMLLYGDPKHPELPGLIDGIKIRRRREAWLAEQPLRPVIRGYGYGSS